MAVAIECVQQFSACTAIECVHTGHCRCVEPATRRASCPPLGPANETPLSGRFAVFLAERVGFEPTWGDYAPIRFRVGAVMTASVPLREGRAFYSSPAA
jgi:hypothetical protein